MFPQIQKGRTAALLLFGTDGTPVIIWVGDGIRAGTKR
jgi:hypothetical protein